MPLRVGALKRPQKALFDYIMGDYETFCGLFTRLLGQSDELRAAMINNAVATHVESLQAKILTAAETWRIKHRVEPSSAARATHHAQVLAATVPTTVGSSELPEVLAPFFNEAGRIHVANLCDLEFWDDFKEYYRRVLAFPYSEATLIRALSAVAEIKYINEQRNYILDAVPYSSYTLTLDAPTGLAGYDAGPLDRIKAEVARNEAIAIQETNRLLAPMRNYYKVCSLLSEKNVNIFSIITLLPILYNTMMILQGKPKILGLSYSLALAAFAYLIKYLFEIVITELLKHTLRGCQHLEENLNARQNELCDLVRLQAVKYIHDGRKEDLAIVPFVTQEPVAREAEVLARDVPPPPAKIPKKVPVGHTSPAPKVEAARAGAGIAPPSTAIIFGPGLVYDPASAGVGNIVKIRGAQNLFAYLDVAALEKQGVSSDELSDFRRLVTEARIIDKGRGIKRVKEGTIIKTDEGKFVPASFKLKPGNEGSRVYAHTLFTSTGAQLLRFNTFKNAKAAHR